MQKLNTTEIQKVNTPKEVLTECQNEVLDDIGIETSIFLLYGSFAYQDLNIPLRYFENLKGPGGAIDKKPDFIAAVSNLEEALRQIGEAKEWRTKDIKNLLKERKDTPFYFNLETNQKFEIKLAKTIEQSSLGYKIGIIADEFVIGNNLLAGGNNIYLSSRLSKPFNVLQGKKLTKEMMEHQLKVARNYFIELTLKTLPAEFSGEAFMEKYVQVTYLAEAYMIYNIIHEKHKDIFNGGFYDLGKNEYVPMKDQIRQELSDKIISHDDVILKDIGLDFDDSIFKNNNKQTVASTLYEFALFNAFSINVSLGKNRRTNKIGGASGLSYVKRKFKK